MANMTGIAILTPRVTQLEQNLCLLEVSLEAQSEVSNGVSLALQSNLYLHPSTTMTVWLMIFLAFQQNYKHLHQ